MKLQALKSIRLTERQRSLDYENVALLKESILSKGLLHPIVVASDPKASLEDDMILVAGLHRLEAMNQLHEEEKSFRCNGELILKGSFPTTLLSDLSPADLEEAQLEENIVRVPLSWQDRSEAITAIFELRASENPKITDQEMARKLKEKGDKRHEDVVAREVRNAKILSKNLHKPQVAKARNATEALGIILREEEARIEAEILRRRKEAQEESNQEEYIKVELGDLEEILPTLPAETFDLIIADLPYGIEADSGGFRKRTVQHHNYKDSKAYAQQLLKATLIEGFRVAKLRANLFFFSDIDLFPLFKEQALAMGWKPFRTPIIWRKSESEGLAPWGREGFRRTYEMIFFATKGSKGLLQSLVDVLDEKRVSRAERRFGPEKPIDLLKTLIECSTMPGDYVLDPCCGSGSTLAACRQTNRRAYGIELDEATYNLAFVAAHRNLEESDYDETDVEITKAALKTTFPNINTPEDRG